MRILLITLVLFLSSCYGTYYISDAEYDDAREEHTSLTYWDNQIYWGWSSGYYYYYGVPHMYPWWHYYTLIPHYTYSVHTHITIFCDNGYYVSKPRGNKFKNNRGGTYKPNIRTVKPNRSRVNTHRPNIRTNSNTKVKTNTRVTITPNRNTKVKTNRNNIKIKTNRNNSNKSTNKTFNNRSNKTNNRKNTRKPR